MGKCPNFHFYRVFQLSTHICEVPVDKWSFLDVHEEKGLSEDMAKLAQIDNKNFVAFVLEYSWQIQTQNNYTWLCEWLPNFATNAPTALDCKARLNHIILLNA